MQRKDIQLETEQYLIASLLVNPESLYSCDLEPSHLAYLSDWLQAIREIYFASGKINIAQLSTKIVEINQNRTVEETRQDMVTLSGMAITKDVTGYVDWLKNAYHVNKMANIARKVLAKSADETASADEIYSLLSSASVDFEIKSVMQSQKEVIAEWVEQQKKIDFTPTGFRDLDGVMAGGLYDGNVYGIAGYAKAGKTMLAGTISGRLARQGIKHLYVAMEMGAGAIEARNVAKGLNMRSSDLRREIRNGRNPIKVDHLHESTIYANCPGVTWEELKQQLLIAVHKHKIKGFIIDYWQLLRNPDRRVDNHQYWATAAQEISDFCKKHNVWCILIAQLNDDGKTLGSRGLVRACDMLLHIEFVEKMPDYRWLKMEATRYTAQVDLGSKTIPYLQINPIGPSMDDLVMRVDDSFYPEER